jgi:hypothetical protein
MHPVTEFIAGFILEAANEYDNQVYEAWLKNWSDFITTYPENHDLNAYVGWVSAHVWCSGAPSNPR